MDSNNGMKIHSSLMLVEIIYGNSGKYNEDDVLAAELELSSRGISHQELDRLRYKVDYISGINPGLGKPSGASTAVSTGDVDELDEEDFELEGMDAIIVKVLMAYLAFTVLNILMGQSRGMLPIIYLLIGLASGAILVYGIYGLWNRKRLPILFLMGNTAYGLVFSVSSLFSLMLNFSGSYMYHIAKSLVIGVATLYFLNKYSIRKVFGLDGDSIMRAIGIGVVIGLFVKFVLFPLTQTM